MHVVSHRIYHPYTIHIDGQKLGTIAILSTLRPAWHGNLLVLGGAHELHVADAERGCQLVKPVSDNGVPVWFGGESNPALRRVAEYGDGWIGFNLLPDQAAEKIKRIEELLKTNGRNRSDVKLAVSPYTNPIKTDDLKRYRDAGVEEVALLASGRPRTERDMIAGLEQMAREFVEPVAKL